MGIHWLKVLVLNFLITLCSLSCFRSKYLSYFFYFFVDKGLVVSICLGGAFVGSLFSGWIADGVGRRRSFQLCALPMIIGAGMRYQPLKSKINFPFIYDLPFL